MTPTLALVALLAAIVVPLIFTGVGGALRKKEFGSVDNNHPRIQQARGTGITARAIGAANNGWEALAMFAPAVLFCLIAAPSSSLAPIFVLAWIPIRLIHGMLYIADRATLRTVFFALGLACAAGLYLIGGHVIAS